VWTDDVWAVDSTPVECAAPARPPGALIWPDGPSTGTAHRIRAGSRPAPAPGVHPAGPARRLRPGRRQSR
jgi:hypothetical protein